MSCPTVVGVFELSASCDGANAFAAQLTLSDITLFISLEEVSATSSASVRGTVGSPARCCPLVLTTAAHSPARVDSRSSCVFIHPLFKTGQTARCRSSFPLSPAAYCRTAAVTPGGASAAAAAAARCLGICDRTTCSSGSRNKPAQVGRPCRRSRRPADAPNPAGSRLRCGAFLLVVFMLIS